MVSPQAVCFFEVQKCSFSVPFEKVSSGSTSLPTFKCSLLVPLRPREDFMAAFHLPTGVFAPADPTRPSSLEFQLFPPRVPAHKKMCLLLYEVGFV